MSNGNRRLSRGDRRRNDRLAALRAVVTRETAVLAFDLAADKQVCALTDQDSRVLGRRTVKAKAWQLAEAVTWGLAQAAAAGFSSVVIACEPTGHRWRVLDQIAEGAGVRLVCVQPLLVHRARESEDFTHNKSDETDAMVIARLVTELRCYLPERADPTWARLRHLGARRLATSIPGLSAVGAAAILAETGDPTRFTSARAMVKHAGLCPRDNASGSYQGKTAISGRGRPQLRLAAWRAVWAALRNNPVLAARYAHLTGRADNKLTKTQARVAVAGSLLRQLHAVITTGTAWDPAIAGGLNPQTPATARGAAVAA